MKERLDEVTQLVEFTRRRVVRLRNEARAMPDLAPLLRRAAGALDDALEMVERAHAQARLAIEPAPAAGRSGGEIDDRV
jgi:hypothetical protein